MYLRGLSFPQFVLLMGTPSHLPVTDHIRAKIA